MRWKSDPRLGIEEIQARNPDAHRLSRFQAPQQPSAMHLANGLFPAADALARFRDVVAPTLKKAILDDNERKLVRANAAITYIFISHRDEARSWPRRREIPETGTPGRRS
jgi:hypothetical protein